MKKNEYVRLIDNVTGKIVTHRGEAMVFPGADESALDGDKLKAMALQEDEFVRIKDAATGKRWVQSTFGNFCGRSHVVFGTPNWFWSREIRTSTLLVQVSQCKTMP